MTKRDINDFLEDLDHEFGEGFPTLEEQGFKIDGDNGIKRHCEQSRRNSADYFFFKLGNSVVLEFSNLQGHLENVRFKAQSIELGATDLRKKERRYYNSLLDSLKHEIKEENIKKFNESSLIAMAIPHFLRKVPEWITSQQKAFFIVVTPFIEMNEELLIKRKRLPVTDEEYSRFLDHLASELRIELPEFHCSKVKVLTLPTFIQALSQ